MLPAAAVLVLVFAAPALSAEAPAPPVSDDEGTPASGGPVTVTSESMEVTGGGSIITFTGDVMARDDFLLCSDFLEIDKSGGGGDVSEIKATGRVRFVMEGKSGKSDRAVYNRAERTIILTGSAEVGQCSDRITGDSITFYLDEGRSVVEGENRVHAVINPDADGECVEKIEDEEDFCRGAR